MMRLMEKDFSDIYKKRTGVARGHAQFVTEFVGGQSADEKGMRAFVGHQLGLEGKDADEAVARIMHEELGEREEVPPEGGELTKLSVYGVNEQRRDEQDRPWIGNWMVQACMKQAMSRLGIFQDLKNKGDFAEAGRVDAWDFSFLDPKHPDRIYILNEDLSGPPVTYWKAFKGNVSTPHGPKSIYQTSECIAPGARFAFEYRFLNTHVKEQDIADMLAFGMTMGLGSVRSLQCGRYKLLDAEIEFAERREKRIRPSTLEKTKPKMNGAAPRKPEDDQVSVS